MRAASTTRRSRLRRDLGVAGLALLLWAGASSASAAPPTPGYPEPVIQWGVQKGETCESIAATVYGSAKHAHLLLRYNRIACSRGAPLREGLTLVLPATVTEVASARVESLNPAVRAKPAGGSWGEATVGQPLSTNSNVNTLETGRAGIGFIDHTRIVLAENTLVVIYGSATQSSVARSRPPAVEVEEGEARAALAALRGGGPRTAVEVAVAGGRVTADSSETVVQKKGRRATVSVFDGSASVESAGARVEVPRNFGSRFSTGEAPSAPRPLPPAPAWESTPPEVALAIDGSSFVAAKWSPVPRARAYRVEIARDDAFTDVVVREEVPASILQLRAERLPGGQYHARVRAIDDEDYLGVATEARPFRVVAAKLVGPGSFEAGRLRVEAGTALDLESTEALEAGGSPDALSAAPMHLALGNLPGGLLWLRSRGGNAVAVAVELPPPAPPPRVAPAPAAPPSPAPTPLPREIGPIVPFVPLGARTDVIAASPTARGAFAAGAAIDAGPDRETRVAGRAWGAGAVGPVSLDGLLTTDADDGVSAWLGGRARVLRLEGSSLELAPILRAGIPTQSGATSRLDVALAGGGVTGEWTWLGNAGARVRLGDGSAATPDAAAPYVVGGGTWDPTAWMRLFAMLDAQLLFVDVTRGAGVIQEVQPAGGLALGVEATFGPAYGGLATRLSPFFTDRSFGGDAALAAQLFVGVRLEPPTAPGP